MKIQPFLFLLLAPLVSTAAVAQDSPEPTPTEQLRLWDGPAPGVPENPGPEKVSPQEHITNISVPMLDVYLPEPGKANGTAIIICSGGGYGELVPGPLGRCAARLFIPEGITVFSLKYRLRPPSKDILNDALADAKRGIRIVRSRASEWHLDPNRIGMVGFSAGANLLLNLACKYDKGDPASADPVERQSSRPDFLGLCCTWPFNQKIEDFKIGPGVPPLYIAHAKDDKIAPFAFAGQIEAAWTSAGVPVHFEPYDTGGHAAFHLPNLKAVDWPGKFVAWLKEQQFVPAK